MAIKKRQYTKDPKKKHGGYRPGGGRPKVDKRVEYTSASYPKMFDSIIRPMVAAKVKELKATKTKPNNLKSVVQKGLPLVAAIVPNPLLDKIVIKKTQPESDYLKQRRKAKQGLK